jgi:hypothetical protein
LPIVLIGQHVTVTNRFIGREFLVIQIIFQPGALYRLTGIPLIELVNQFHEIETINLKNTIRNLQLKSL